MKRSEITFMVGAVCLSAVIIMTVFSYRLRNNEDAAVPKEGAEDHQSAVSFSPQVIKRKEITVLRIRQRSDDSIKYWVIDGICDGVEVKLLTSKPAMVSRFHENETYSMDVAASKRGQLYFVPIKVHGVVR